MTKRTRTAIFIACVFLFSLTAPSVIFYSQGYRFDFEERKIVQTGGLYFKVLPGKASVYLNGEFKKNTSMMNSSVFIENLLPKTYDIEIKKDGFHPWKKALEVKEKEVVEAKNIILFPEKLVFSQINYALPKIRAWATSSDKNKVIESNGYEILVNLLKEGQRIFLTRFSEKIGNIFWLNDYYLIFNVGDKIKISEIDNRDGLNIIDLAEFGEPKIFWNKDTNKLYVLSRGKMYLLENLLP